MRKFSEKQLVQEKQYDIPHHYIPKYKNGFRTAVYSGFGINYVSTVEFIISEIGKIKFESLADVGTGDGRLVREISEAFPEKYISGIDYSERAINLAKGFNPHIDFHNVNIIEDKIDKKFDVLTLIEVFEHLPLDTAPKFVTSLKDILSEKGYLLLTVPHENLPVSKKHYQHFNGERLKKYFSEHFEVEGEVYFEDHRNWRNYLIRRVLKNKMFILNHRGLLNYIYKVYKKRCFHTTEQKSARIYLKLRKKY